MESAVPADLPRELALFKLVPDEPDRNVVSAKDQTNAWRREKPQISWRA